MPFVIPYFIPHQGCPHHCLFCDQRAITGTFSEQNLTVEEIGATIEQWLSYRRAPVKAQVAFYGGSFTCLDEQLQAVMLEAVSPWIAAGEVSGIRLSTRPDCIDRRCCDMLRHYGVETVELGVQSLDNRVLAAARRGHTVEDCETAMRLLGGNGFRLGIQLMPGLPLEDRASFRRTVKKAITMEPSFVRLYPTVVVKGSGLAEMYESGGYRPLSLDMAVILTAWARKIFTGAGIDVVRMGLQHSASLEKSILTGPYHSAFGELVLARQWFGRIQRLLSRYPGRTLQLRISTKDRSAFYGVKNSNRERWRTRGLEKRMKVVFDNTLERGRVKYVVC